MKEEVARAGTGSWTISKVEDGGKEERREGESDMRIRRGLSSSEVGGGTRGSISSAATVMGRSEWRRGEGQLR